MIQVGQLRVWTGQSHTSALPGYAPGDHFVVTSSTPFVWVVMLSTGELDSLEEDFLASESIEVTTATESDR